MKGRRLGSLKLYKFDVPYESDVGVIVVSHGAIEVAMRIPLTKYTGRRQGRGSKAGLSKSFLGQIRGFFIGREDSNLLNQIFDYIVSNFCFKDLSMVPPACPVLVFHLQTREFGQDHHVPEIIDMTELTSILLNTLGTGHSVMADEDAINRCVPIAPPATEILDCYRSFESCSLCEKGYPEEGEIVHKTTCNHIFHGTCISRYLLRIPHCPVCTTHLPPVDIRTLLFS
ncbi:hypothetical protein Bca4012_100380 [Brassica carinata]|uniref:RING-type domain-containing protein n=2 Tax=Brassica TaxID=3705 RepID=A0A8X7TUR5_BRACI|nr:hypothetical protein Bca52824_082922 [Brassica carinata]VDD62785.1 unnamed protein product [Brassica oleracea]